MSTLKAKEVIKDKGMTIEEVASRMGITKGSLSAALSGNPTVAYLERVANASSNRTFMELKLPYWASYATPVGF